MMAAKRIIPKCVACIHLGRAEDEYPCNKCRYLDNNRDYFDKEKNEE